MHVTCSPHAVQLKDSTFDTSGLDEFPGKHWFGSLSAEQLLARRIGLERYLHSVCQDRVIGVSSLLKEFLIAIQKVWGSGLPTQMYYVAMATGITGVIRTFRKCASVSSERQERQCCSRPV